MRTYSEGLALLLGQFLVLYELIHEVLHSTTRQSPGRATSSSHRGGKGSGIQ